MVFKTCDIGKNSSILLRVLFCVLGINTHAQLGFCQGNSGDAIFFETFGTGTTATPLPSGTTTYTFTSTDPHDGFYTVSSNTGFFDWHDIPDHTEGDVNGKSLIINADFTSGEFYRTTVNGLCENTSYEFSSWLINLLPANGCGGNGIPINVGFEIWDVTDSNLLASGNTGSIFGSSSPNWQQYGLVFQTQPSQTSVILKMINNGVGGCGNDLAIDDIVFKTCGDFISLEDENNNENLEICSTQSPYSLVITAIPDNSIFASHFYQWQESIDANSWTDIIGETSISLAVSGLTSTTFYRAKVAESASNLNNEDCITFSNVYSVVVNQAPDEPSTECWESTIFNESTCSWQIIGNQPVEPTGLECWQDTVFNNDTCSWDVIGTQPEQPTNLECWQSTVFNTTTCSWDIFGSEPIEILEEEIFFCHDNDVTLSGYIGIFDAQYLWNTGEITEEIEVSEPGIYTVEVSSGACFTTIKTISVREIVEPIIEAVISEGNDIIINTANEGYYEYSLDGFQFQSNSRFINVLGGLYNVFVREVNGCGVATATYLHFIIPKYFTPNNDGYNDSFDLRGLEYFDDSEVYIFDRYGRLIKNSKNQSFSWDGTINNKKLPTSDYWYIIKINDQTFKGHFTLKR